MRHTLVTRLTIAFAVILVLAVVGFAVTAST